MIVDNAEAALHVLASESGADIVVGIGVSSWAALLHPLESLLDLAVPNRVLILTLLSIRVRWYINALLIPVYAATAVRRCILLIAARHAYASVEVPVSLTLVRSRELLLAVERSTEVGNEAANLISRPVSEMSSASSLEEIGVSRVKAETASVSVAAISLAAASVSSHCDPVVLWVRRVEVPIARANVSLGILGTWGSTLVGGSSSNVSGTE